MQGSSALILVALNRGELNVKGSQLGLEKGDYKNVGRGS
jgi:hypothetical protein